MEYLPNSDEGLIKDLFRDIYFDNNTLWSIIKNIIKTYPNIWITLKNIPRNFPIFLKNQRYKEVVYYSYFLLLLRQFVLFYNTNRLSILESVNNNIDLYSPNNPEDCFRYIIDLLPSKEGAIIELRNTEIVFHSLSLRSFFKHVVVKQNASECSHKAYNKKFYNDMFGNKGISSINNMLNDIVSNINNHLFINNSLGLFWATSTNLVMDTTTDDHTLIMEELGMTGNFDGDDYLVTFEIPKKCITKTISPTLKEGYSNNNNTLNLYRPKSLPNQWGETVNSKTFDAGVPEGLCEKLELNSQIITHLGHIKSTHLTPDDYLVLLQKSIEDFLLW